MALRVDASIPGVCQIMSTLYWKLEVPVKSTYGIVNSFDISCGVKWSFQSYVKHDPEKLNLST